MHKQQSSSMFKCIFICEKIAQKIIQNITQINNTIASIYYDIFIILCRNKIKFIMSILGIYFKLLGSIKARNKNILLSLKDQYIRIDLSIMLYQIYVLGRVTKAITSFPWYLVSRIINQLDRRYNIILSVELSLIAYCLEARKNDLLT